MLCTQCKNREAIIDYEGHKLCNDCNLKFVQTIEIKQRMLAEEENFATDMMEASVGLPRGTLPRYPIKKPTIINAPDNSIKIDRSIIGAINQGEISNLEVNLNKINQSNNALGVELKDFSELVLKSADLDHNTKEKIIEGVDFLAQEIVKENPKKNLITSVVEQISNWGGASQTVIAAWNLLYPHILNSLK